ncbi:Protein kinase-like domain [Pseudocohnilembus persalinus]|uniref:cGMP-dependent protein kinase n=1 Tax=Pseudocohnilembus persalinus TaxID=266149 RepID=A0A0V0R9H0_PSEPJ|nr:Protein kinase-like domain [Pseudocohnilembus persalinus]|eukprot:KRX11142.1 Protein kinase-like domain [Pseudocohnilembus persalinus]
MGCGQSIQMHNDADAPQKTKKSKFTPEQDKILGNEVPKYFIEGQKNNKYDYNIDSNREGQDTPTNQAKPQKTRHEKKQKQGFKHMGDNETTDIHENIVKKKKNMKHEDLQLIVQSLKGHFVFYALSDSELEYIVRKMFYCEVANGQYIFKQGNQASTYFILASGKIEIIIDGQSKKVLERGVGFGELALLYNAPRSASVRCIGNCSFWAIDRNSFKTTVEEMVHKEFASNRSFMENVQFFNFMNSDQKDSIAQGLISQKFEKGEVIVNDGDQADSFYMIKEGSVTIYKGTQFIRTLYKGESFGEQALYMSSVRWATVKADETVKVLSLGRKNITKILGDKVQIIIYNNLQRWSFDKSPLLKGLTKLQVEKVTQYASISNFKKGDVILKQGKKCEAVIIILEGDIKGQRSGSTLGVKGGIYGDQYIKKSHQQDILEEDVVMGSDGVLSTIPFKYFFKAVGDTDIEQVIKKNEFGHEKKMAAIDEKPDYSHILLENLIFIKKLGFGQFGTVYLVKEKGSKNKEELFALKCVSKAQVIEQNLEKHLVQEKTVLEQVHFPFIMNFYRTFKDNNQIYFLTEFISGLELFDVIREIGLLSTQDSQYYSGSMILALEYLHGKSIIYRDIKPENIMVNANGHMFLIDMGTAKILKHGKHPGRTFTIIGTPHYMAPEIIQQKGYSYAIDLWSVGICIYEFMCGAVPYAEEAEDPFEIYEEIMSSEVKFPNWMKDKKGRRFIEQLLSKVPELRLGGSYAALKANPWFDTFDWDKLYNKELEPPFIIPEEKVVSRKEIKAQFSQQVPVTKEIQLEQTNNKSKYRRENARDPHWDKDF